MKLVIEVDLELDNPKHQVKQMINHMLDALEDIPPMADLRTPLLKNSEAAHAILGEALDNRQETAQARIAIVRNDFDRRCYARDELKRPDVTGRMEERIINVR